MRRLVNQHPGRGGMLLLSILPFILLISAYLVGSNVRLAANPGDKLLPSPAMLASTIHRYAFEQDERTGEILFWADTSASLKRILTALGISAFSGLTLGAGHRRHPVCQSDARDVHRGAVVDSALGDPAHIVHRRGPRRTREGVAHHHRCRTDHRARSGAANRGVAGRTNHQGANAGRLHLATDHSRRHAADVAAAHRRAALEFGIGLAVPHRLRSHRFDRGPRLSNISGPALSGDGRDPALCRVDHVARVWDGCVAAPRARQSVSLGGGRASRWRKSPSSGFGRNTTRRSCSKTSICTSAITNSSRSWAHRDAERRRF